MQSVRLHLCGVQTRRQDLGVQPPGLGEDGHVPTILGTFALATEEILGKYTEGYTSRGANPDFRLPTRIFREELTKHAKSINLS